MFKQLSRKLRTSQTGLLLSVLLLTSLAALAGPALRHSRQPAPDARRTILATSPSAPSEASTKVQRELDAPQTLAREFPFTAPDGAPFDFFGKSVAISGNTAIVGADEYGTGQFFHKGKVYFFVRIAADWVLQQSLTVTDGQPGDRFGYSVAIDGDTTVVGAFNVANRRGAVYIFVRNGPVGQPWTHQQTIMAPNGTSGDHFGATVAISGNTVVVGSRADGTTPHGAAFVWVRNGTDWAQEAKLLPNDGVIGDHFGYSVGVSTNTIVVGAPGKSIGTNRGQGAVYVFLRRGTDWSQAQRLTATDGGDADLLNNLGDQFGFSVSINGGSAIFGAPGKDIGSKIDQGAAYVFARQSGTWAEQQRLTPNDGARQDGFGWAVGINNRMAILSNAITPYIFKRDGTGWVQRQKLTRSDVTRYDGFGLSVGVSSTTAIAGAPFHKVGENISQGAAYLYDSFLDSDGDALPDDWEINGITIDGVFIDLPTMGADPMHKDVFVHADWMEPDPLDPTVIFEPNPRAIKIVTDAFAIAPVENPNGKIGIRLHVDAGPNSIMNPVTGARWGGLSRAGQMAYLSSIGFFVDDDPDDYHWGAVDTRKEIYFMPSKRAAVFHYVLFCNTYAGDDSSGVSRDIAGTDFLVSLGADHWDGPPTSRRGGTITQQAGTFMHELGHNLGLEHGGDDDINNKPNYQSIMNYAFQFTGLLKPDGQRSFDYSRDRLPDLDEFGLNENAGINDPGMHLTFWNRFTHQNIPPQANRCLYDRNYYRWFFPSRALDWDCDGARSPFPYAEPQINPDINGDGTCVRALGATLNSTPSGDDERRPVRISSSVPLRIVAGPDHLCQTLAAAGDRQIRPVNYVEPNLLLGFKDWPALIFDGGGRIGDAAGLSELPDVSSASQELTRDQLEDFVPEELLAEDALTPLDEVTLAPTNGSAPLVVIFDGTASTAISGSISTWSWNFGDGTSGSGATVTHTYTTPGEYYASLTVTDSNDRVNLVPLLYLVRVTAGAPTPTPTPNPTASPTPTPQATPTPTPGPGDVDPTWDATVSGNFATLIHTILAQPDGKILVGGNFETFAGCARQSLARINADGSCDTTFNHGLAFTRELFSPGSNSIPFRPKPPVRALALQPDGKILVGLGYESCCAFQQPPMIVRLNSDGTLDSSFNLSGLGNQDTFPASVYSVALQADGRIIIGGLFAFNANGAFGANSGLANIARLNSNGSLDTSFNASVGTIFSPPFFSPNSVVNAVAVQPDGKVIIGGGFTRVGGNIQRTAIARLNTDGSNDESFNAGNSLNALNTIVYAIVLQPDGKILAAGDVWKPIGGGPQTQNVAVVRLNADGSRDSGFSNYDFGLNYGAGRSLSLQADGKIVIVGDFRITTQPTRTFVARLNSDGTPDTSYDTGTGTFPPLNDPTGERSVDAVALAPDGKAIIGGQFAFYQGEVVQQILKLNTDGSRDVTFDSNGPGYNASVFALARQPDGKLLVGFNKSSRFTRLNAHRTGGIGRLNVDGTTDTTFTSPFDDGLFGTTMVVAIAVQNDGKVLIGGDFRLRGSTIPIYLARLNANGTLDTTFNGSADNQVQAFALQADGKIIVGGSFTTVSGVGQQGLARLNADGTFDPTFASNGVGGGVRSLLIQPDGRILVAGGFQGLNSTLRNNIARLNTDGSIDNSFDPGVGPDNAISGLLLQPDGKIIIGGFFLNYGNTPRLFMARINSDGQLDTSFNPVNPNQRVVSAMALQSNGKIYVGSLGSTFAPTFPPPNYLYRLNADGSLDSSFPFNSEVELDVTRRYGDVHTMLLQSDERLIIGGNFDVVSDAGRISLARVITALPPSPSPTPTPTPSPTPTPTPSPTPIPTPTPMPTPTPRTLVQFESSIYGRVEDCTSVTITVVRSGDISGPSSVHYTTADITATNQGDYIVSSGSLGFAPGETSKSFAVLINEDARDEGTEFFEVRLSNPSGAGIGAEATTAVRITDDLAELFENPNDDARTFVCQHYHDFLNRQPDTSGLDFWANQILSCGGDQACIEVKRINVSAAFYLSIEFQETGYLVERIYKAAYGDATGTSTLPALHSLPVPIVRFNELNSDTQKIGQGVVVGEGNWAQILEANKEAFTTEFVQRARFVTAFPSTMTAAQFVDTLNANAGNPLSTSERDQLVNDLSTNAKTRAQALRVVAEDVDLKRAEFNRAFVLMEFFGYLRRNPNDPQDTDYTGYDFWLTKLNSFGNFQDAEMVKAFITSIEYRLRFGP